MTTLERLADYVVGFEPASLHERTRIAIHHAILDLVGAAVAGSKSDAVRSVRNLAVRQYTGGSATVWFDGCGLTPAGAAFANASAASALDLDDGHRGAGGHPGASIIPAAFAVAQCTGSDTERLFAAIALGYEVAVRVSAARDFTRLDTLSTGRWCGYGAAAAAAYLMRLDRVQTAEAMAIAGVAAPGLSAAGYSRRMGNSVKEGIPWATAIALTGAELAREGGYTGPTDILDHPDYYDAAVLLAGLGGSFAIERIYHKPYACCRWIHAALDAVLALRHESEIEPSAIDAIEVHTFERALRLSNEVAPVSLEGAQYSLPFCVAVAAVDGETALLPMAPKLLERVDIRAVSAKVRMIVDPALNAAFPRQAPARVRILSREGVVEREVLHARGDPDNPMGEQGLLDKFVVLAGESDRAQRLATSILSLGESGTFGSLMAVLAAPI